MDALRPATQSVATGIPTQSVGTRIAEFNSENSIILSIRIQTKNILREHFSKNEQKNYPP